MKLSAVGFTLGPSRGQAETLFALFDSNPENAHFAKLAFQQKHIRMVPG